MHRAALALVLLVSLAGSLLTSAVLASGAGVATASAAVAAVADGRTWVVDAVDDTASNRWESVDTGTSVVTIAVGEHIRAPRMYRGRDLEWWMDAAGVLDERYDQVDDIGRARRVPSLQLAGTPDRSTLDLNALFLEAKTAFMRARVRGRRGPVQRLLVAGRSPRRVLSDAKD